MEILQNSGYNNNHLCTKGPQIYINEPIAFNKIRVISQLRVMGEERINLFKGVFKCKSEANNTCNLNVLDDMFHFLYECLHFNSLRNSLIIKYLKLPY